MDASSQGFLQNGRMGRGRGRGNIHLDYGGFGGAVSRRAAGAAALFSTRHLSL
jgi:hypothetical protein